MGTNRFSDMEEGKRNEADAEAADNVLKGGKAEASSRVDVSEGPAEDSKKREVVEKLEKREGDS